MANDQPIQKQQQDQLDDQDEYDQNNVSEQQQALQNDSGQYDQNRDLQEYSDQHINQFIPDKDDQSKQKKQLLSTSHFSNINDQEKKKESSFPLFYNEEKCVLKKYRSQNSQSNSPYLIRREVVSEYDYNPFSQQTQGSTFQTPIRISERDSSSIHDIGSVGIQQPQGNIQQPQGNIQQPQGNIQFFPKETKNFYKIMHGALQKFMIDNQDNLQFSHKAKQFLESKSKFSGKQKFINSINSCQQMRNIARKFLLDFQWCRYIMKNNKADLESYFRLNEILISQIQE